MAKSFVALCSHCRQRLKLSKPELVGRKVKCPACEQPFVVKPVKRKSSSSAAVSSAQSPPRSSDGSGKPSRPRRPQPEAHDERQGRNRRPRPTSEPADHSNSGDGWLDDVDSFDDESIPVASAPPRRSSGRKKSRARPEPEPEAESEVGLLDRFRDEDGDLPLWIHYILMIATGCVGGLIGIFIWGAIIAKTGYEVGYVAILVGALVGMGVRVGASERDYGWGPALTASFVAIFALVGGKIFGANWYLSEALDEIQVEFSIDEDYLTHDNAMIARIASDVDDEFLEQNRDITVADGVITEDDYDPESGELKLESLHKEFYPDVWTEAGKRWNALSDDEQEQQRAEAVQEMEDVRDMVEAPTVGLSDLSLLFSPHDILWFVLAISSAFKIAAGMDDDD